MTMPISDLLNYIHEWHPVSINDAFDIWSEQSFTSGWLGSPWWYLHGSEVRKRFLQELVRILRSDGRFAIVDDMVVRVEGDHYLEGLRADGRLTHEEGLLSSTTPP